MNNKQEILRSFDEKYIHHEDAFWNFWSDIIDDENIDIEPKIVFRRDLFYNTAIVSMAAIFINNSTNIHVKLPESFCDALTDFNESLFYGKLSIYNLHGNTLIESMRSEIRDSIIELLNLYPSLSYRN